MAHGAQTAPDLGQFLQGGRGQTTVPGLGALRAQQIRSPASPLTLPGHRGSCAASFPSHVHQPPPTPSRGRVLSRQAGAVHRLARRHPHPAPTPNTHHATAPGARLSFHGGRHRRFSACPGCHPAPSNRPAQGRVGPHRPLLPTCAGLRLPSAIRRHLPATRSSSHFSCGLTPAALPSPADPHPPKGGVGPVRPPLRWGSPCAFGLRPHPPQGNAHALRSVHVPLPRFFSAAHTQKGRLTPPPVNARFHCQRWTYPPRFPPLRLHSPAGKEPSMSNDPIIIIVQFFALVFGL